MVIWRVPDGLTPRLECQGKNGFPPSVAAYRLRHAGQGRAAGPMGGAGLWTLVEPTYRLYQTCALILRYTKNAMPGDRSHRRAARACRPTG